MVYIAASLHLGIFKSSWTCSCETALGAPAWAGGLDKLNSRGFNPNNSLPLKLCDSSFKFQYSYQIFPFPFASWAVLPKGLFGEAKLLPGMWQVTNNPTLLGLFLLSAGHTQPKEWGCQLPPHAVQSSLGEEFLVGYNLWQLPPLQGDKTASKRMRNARGLLPKAVNAPHHSSHLPPKKLSVLTEKVEILATFHGGI